jgi:hypothetical protein
VNQFPETAFITAVGHGSREGTIDAAAHRTSAQPVVIAIRIRRHHTFTADGAYIALNGFHGGKAFRADR